jgi:hypothetical protein
MGKHADDLDCFTDHEMATNTGERLQLVIAKELAIIADALENMKPVPLDPVYEGTANFGPAGIKGFCQTCRFHEFVEPYADTTPCHVHGSFILKPGFAQLLTADDFGCVHYERGRAWGT